jgi:hypothetical protein
MVTRYDALKKDSSLEFAVKFFDNFDYYRLNYPNNSLYKATDSLGASFQKPVSLHEMASILSEAISYLSQYTPEQLKSFGKAGISCMSTLSWALRDNNTEEALLKDVRNKFSSGNIGLYAFGNTDFLRYAVIIEGYRQLLKYNNDGTDFSSVASLYHIKKDQWN